MITDSDQQTLEILNHFYNKLEINFMKSKKPIRGNSLLLTLITLKENLISELLTDSSINVTESLKDYYGNLVGKGYIRRSDDLEKNQDYILTAQGIWFYESNTKDLDVSHLLQYFESTYFTFKSRNKPLSDNEKIILISMIAIRNFSPGAAMDLSNPAMNDYWIEIFDSVNKFLLLEKMIKKTNWRDSGRGVEHPVPYAMRRVNNLPQKTKHIYKSMGGNKYYLDIDKASNTTKMRLIFLFRIVIGNIESKDQIKRIHSFLSDIAFDKGKYVRDNFVYINPEWDGVLREALDELYFLK